MSFPKRRAPDPSKAVEPASSPARDPSSIGSILLKIGAITAEQLDKALEHKVQFDEALLGSLLRQSGHVTGKDMALAMKIQHELRQGSTLTAELDVLQRKMDESAERTYQLATCISRARVRRTKSTHSADVFVVPPNALARAGS